MKVILIALLLIGVVVAEMQETEDSLPAPAIPKPGDSTGCTICKWIVTSVSALLAKNNSQQQIVKVLTKGCDVFFISSWITQCQGYVQNNVPMIIQLLQQGVNPNQVCTKVGLCSGSDELPEIQRDIRRPLVKAFHKGKRLVHKL